MMIITKISSFFGQRKPRTTLIVLAAAIPLIFLITLIGKYGVNTPHMDQWALVPLLEKADTGTLTFTDFWEQHNEHRIVIPRVALLGIAKLTNWYTPAEIIASVIISAATLIIIIDLLKRSFGTRSWLLLILVFLSSAWYFSPIQWENWLWGFQIGWFLCISSVIVSVWSLYRLSESQSSKWFILALGSATVAMFSLGSGVLIWLVGLFALLSFSSIGNSKKYLFVWTAFGVLETFAYYRSYVKPTAHPTITYALENPTDFIAFFVTTLGRPFTDHPETALLMGYLILATFIIVLFLSFKIYHQKRNLLTVWYSIVLYSLLGLGLASVSRVGFGIPSAMSSRYTALSVLLIVGLLGLFSVLIGVKPEKQRLTPVLSLALISVPLLAFSYTAGIRGMDDWSTQLKFIRTCTREANPTRECLLTTCPPCESFIGDRVRYIKEHNYNGY